MCQIKVYSNVFIVYTDINLRHSEHVMTLCAKMRNFTLNITSVHPNLPN